MNDFIKIMGLVIVILVFIFGIIFITALCEKKQFDKEIEKYNNAIQEKVNQRMQRYTIIEKYGFYIYKIHNDEKYYLSFDGCFYTSQQALKKFEFNSMEEMQEYITNKKKQFNNLYGEFDQEWFVQGYHTLKHLDYCKKLEDTFIPIQRKW